MADVTVAANEVGSGPVSLSANAAKSVQYSRDLSEVEIGNLGGTDVVWVAFIDRNHSAVATVGGKHCYPIYPNSVATIPVRTDGDTLISVISASATTVYSNAT